MKKLILLSIMMLFSVSLFAQNIPSVSQIYQAVENGNLSRASQMIQVVLQAHPNSAKAHYVDAEILAREGRLSQARSEFQTAKNISANLSFVSPDSVMKLKSVLYRQHRYVTNEDSGHFPFMALILLIAAILFIFLIIRAFKQKQNVLSRPYANNSTNNSTTNTQGGYQNSRGGFGGIGSGLASGLAAGVGFAAGEELFDHFTHDNNNNLDSSSPQDNNNVPQDDGLNQQPIDQDFGISDDSSWGDDSSSDFGGDDSW